MHNLPVVVEVAIAKQNGAQVKHGLELCVVLFLFASGIFEDHRMPDLDVLLQKHGKIGQWC